MARAAPATQWLLSSTVVQTFGARLTSAHVSVPEVHVADSLKAIWGGLHVIVEVPHAQPQVGDAACSTSFAATPCAKPDVHGGGAAVPE
jgi:hypothetical protein